LQEEGATATPIGRNSLPPKLLLLANVPIPLVALKGIITLRIGSLSIGLPMELGDVGSSEDDSVEWVILKAGYAIAPVRVVLEESQNLFCHPWFGYPAGIPNLCCVHILLLPHTLYKESKGNLFALSHKIPTSHSNHNFPQPANPQAQ
jgi:hypothetical protein